MNSFEFSEWIVSTVSHSLRLFIIYRPPYSDDHKVPSSVFFREFSDYVESVLLSKEQILLTGDLNIHVYDISISDTRRFADLLESFHV